MKKKKFVLNRGEHTIGGTIYCMPGDDRKRKAVILSHGFYGSQKETGPYACYLASHGFCAVTFDFYGGSRKGESGGSLYHMTIESEKTDLMSVIEYVRKLPFLDLSELTLIGCSQGAVISALVAAEHADIVSSLVLVYPALCITDDAKKGRMLVFRFDPENVPEEVDFFGLRLSGNYIRQVQELDILRKIDSFPGRVLLLYGKKDRVVSNSYMDELIARRDGRIESMPLEKGTHGFKKECLQGACKRTLMFLQHNKEFLQVDVLVKKVKVTCRGSIITADLYFDANATGPVFHGRSLPGARDRQIRRNLKPVEFTADYTLEGEDNLGEHCHIHIINRNTGDGWVPEISTDSRALDSLNRLACQVVEDHWQNGLTVRFFYQ